MLEAVDTDLVFTISLKRSTQNLQLSTSSPADYPIFWGKADIQIAPRMSAFGGGFNRSTQHLLILLEEEVCDGGDCTDMVHAAAEG